MTGDSRWQLRYPSPDLVRHYRESSWWSDDTLSEIAFNGVKDAAAVSCRVRSRIHPFVGSIGDLGDMGRRLAGALVRRGIVPGDVVAFQLPNWAEAVACFYGLLPLGVVLIPIVHIYGSKEVGHILRQSKARVLITTDRFGRQDYVANLEAASPNCLISSWWCWSRRMPVRSRSWRRPSFHGRRPSSWGIHRIGPLGWIPTAR